MSTRPRNAKGLICSACSRSGFTVGQQGDREMCNYQEVSEQRLEDRSGRTRLPRQTSRADTEQSQSQALDWLGWINEEEDGL